MYFEFQHSSYKAARYSNESITEYVENLLEMAPLRITWKPVNEIMNLGGIKLLIQLIAASFDWNYTGKYDLMNLFLRL